MSTQPTPRPKLSPAERLALIQQQANQPIACEKCGSLWFSDVSFQQYSGNLYATTPGGDMQVVSALVHRIRVCICGHPVDPNLGGVRPGRTAATEVASFMESFNAAKAYLKSIGEIDPAQLVGDFPTRDDFEKLVKQVDELKKKLETAAPDHTPEEETTDSAAEPAKRRGRPAKKPAAGESNAQ